MTVVDCGGGSACGWTYCEALDKSVQEWETPCPPASTATEPGVVNYFDTVAKPANTDCNGGESVGVGCASGTTLSRRQLERRRERKETQKERLEQVRERRRRAPPTNYLFID